MAPLAGGGTAGASVDFGLGVPVQDVERFIRQVRPGLGVASPGPDCKVAPRAWLMQSERAFLQIRSEATFSGWTICDPVAVTHNVMQHTWIPAAIEWWRDVCSAQPGTSAPKRPVTTMRTLDRREVHARRAARSGSPMAPLLHPPVRKR